MINKILDIIAKIYIFIWARVCQRKEPFTPQFCRLEQSSPGVFWGASVALILYMGILLVGASFWQTIIIGAIAVFLVWFFPHVLEYRINHPENVPNLVRWANKRLRR